MVVISVGYIYYKSNEIKRLTAYQNNCNMNLRLREKHKPPTRRHTMTNSEYSKKWNRDEEDNFATFLTNWHAGDQGITAGTEELDEEDIENANPVDMADWGITDSQEWVDAYNVAITELRK